MSRTDITFIIPVFNGAGTIARTLDAVTAQSTTAWSAIVVDDGSTDASAEIVAGYTGRRVRLIQQSNAGLAGARNTGFRAATGATVCFLDADDLVDPDFAERMLGALSGGADLAACVHRYVGPAGEDLGWVMRPGDQDLLPRSIIEYNPLAVGAVVMKRDAPARLGALGSDGTLFDPSLPVHEDWDLWMRLGAAGARWAPIVDEALFAYRLSPGSMSANLERMWKVGLRVIERAPADAFIKPPALRRWTIRALARAVAYDEDSLARAARAELGTLTPDDTGVLAGSLRWAFCHARIVPPAEAHRHEAEWRACVEFHLRGEDIVPDLLARLDWAEARWKRVAEEAARRALGGRIVIFGMGRNGRALADALAALGERPGSQECALLPLGRLPVAWMDDRREASPPRSMSGAPRLGLPDLRTDDVVVVTPDHRGQLMERLEAMGIAQVHTAESLLARDGHRSLAA